MSEDNYDRRKIPSQDKNQKYDERTSQCTYDGSFIVKWLSYEELHAIILPIIIMNCGSPHVNLPHLVLLMSHVGNCDVFLNLPLKPK